MTGTQERKEGTSDGLMKMTNNPRMYNLQTEQKAHQNWGVVARMKIRALLLPEHYDVSFSISIAHKPCKLPRPAAPTATTSPSSKIFRDEDRGQIRARI